MDKLMAWVRPMAREIVGYLREFWREVVSIPGLTLLGYVTIVCTHKVALDDDALARFLKALVPYGEDRLIRKNVLDVFFFGVVAVLLVLFLHRQNPVRQYGLKWPEKRWVVLTGVIFAFQIFGIIIAAQIPSLREFYPMFRPARAGGGVFWGFEALAFVSMVSWEFVNRGYLLFGLKDRMGWMSVLVQVVPFGILHFGKPVLEIYWSILDGIGLALLAYAANSIWPAVFLHGVGAFLLDVALVYVFPQGR